MTDDKKAQDRAMVGAASTASPLQALILDLWQRIRIDWGFASERLAAAFRNNRQLGSQQRRFVAETLYGMIRHLRRIDTALDAAGLRTVTQAPDRERLLAYLVLEEGLSIQDAARHRRDLNWNQVAEIDDKFARETNLTRRIAVQHSLPDWLAQALVADTGERAESIARALNTRAPMTIRVNTLRGDIDVVASELAALGIETERGRFARAALHVKTRTNLFGLDPFRAGMFEAQDEGSQLIAELVAPPPKPRVVDYCAGAGGKTLALAAMMTNRGRIVAVDIDDRKLTELKRRARRAGVSNAQAVSISVADDAPFPDALSAFEGRAHRVLVDAPCSGIGALRRNPEARWRLTPSDLERLPAQQRAICERALPLVGPGGRLIYATCTLLNRENQAIVAELLDAHPELELVPPKQIWGKERAGPISDPTTRFFSVAPDVHGTDGFFAAVLRVAKRDAS